MNQKYANKEIPLVRGKDDIIPCIKERCFAYVYDQNKNNLAHLLAYILKIDVNIIKDNIVKISNNQEVKNKKDKQRRMDFVYRIDKLNLNIELNLRPKPIKERNMNYLMGLHLNSLNKNTSEGYYHTIQININNEIVIDTNNEIDKYYFRNKDGKVYSKNISFYVINIPIIRKKWYTMNEEEKINYKEEYKYLISFFDNDLTSLKNIYKGDGIVMDILKRQEEFSSDNKEWVTYREENELENEKKLEIKMAKDEGIIERNYEIAKNLLSLNVDIDIIIKSTNLTKEEILKIKEEM